MGVMLVANSRWLLVGVAQRCYGGCCAFIVSCDADGFQCKLRDLSATWLLPVAGTQRCQLTPFGMPTS